MRFEIAATGECDCTRTKVVSLGKKELTLGLTYVALSRVKALGGLLLMGNYSRDRIMRVNLNSKHAERDAAEAWLDTLQGQ